MMNDERVLFLEKQLERVNYWLSFAEAKNAGLIVVNTTALSFLTGLFQYASTVCSVAMIGLLASSFICVISFWPNMSSNSSSICQEPKDKESGQQVSIPKNQNLLFYRDISEIKTVKEYFTCLDNKKYFSCNSNEQGDVNGVLNDYADEILINSRITVRKNECFKKAILIDCLCLVVCIVAVIIA